MTDTLAAIDLFAPGSSLYKLRENRSSDDDHDRSSLTWSLTQLYDSKVILLRQRQESMTSKTRVGLTILCPTFRSVYHLQVDSRIRHLNNGTHHPQLNEHCEACPPAQLLRVLHHTWGLSNSIKCSPHYQIYGVSRCCQ